MKNDCVKRNFESMEAHLTHWSSKERIKILKRFLGKLNPSVDVGCGAFMPFILKVDYACDYNLEAKKYLKKLGWKGQFKVANVRKLPYKNKQFKVAICSEVIEHLKNKSQVNEALLELDRVSVSWIVTTPSVYVPDKDHRLFFCSGNIYDFIPFERSKFIVIEKGATFYISNNINKLRRICL